MEKFKHDTAIYVNSMRFKVYTQVQTCLFKQRVYIFTQPVSPISVLLIIYRSFPILEFHEWYILI